MNKIRDTEAYKKLRYWAVGLLPESIKWLIVVQVADNVIPTGESFDNYTIRDLIIRQAGRIDE